MQPKLDPNFPALILKMSRGVIHHGALAVARTLGRAGVPVYAVVEDAYTPLALSRYLTKAFVWDSCPEDPESFVREMEAIGKFIGRPTIVIPMDDLSAVFLAANAASLAGWFVVPPVAPDVPHRLANKAGLHALCDELGIPSARTIFPHSLEDVRAFAGVTSFPVLVKGTEQWVPLKDMSSTRVIPTADELCTFCENHDYEGSQPLLVEEYIPGEDWISHGYYNSEKNVSMTFTGRKLRSYPNDAGSTALGLSVENEELRRVSEKLLHAIGYSGIIDMDWRRDERDGQYKIVDCNPRVGQNFRMFENPAGVDVVRAQHLDLSGRRFDNASLVESRLFRVESFYVMALLRRLPRGASKQDAAKYLPAKSRELAWWSSDDPIPVLSMSVRLALRLLGRALGFRPDSPAWHTSGLSRLFSH